MIKNYEQWNSEGKVSESEEINEARSIPLASKWVFKDALTQPIEFSRDLIKYVEGSKDQDPKTQRNLISEFLRVFKAKNSKEIKTAEKNNDLNYVQSFLNCVFDEVSKKFPDSFMHPPEKEKSSNKKTRVQEYKELKKIADEANKKLADFVNSTLKK